MRQSKPTFKSASEASNASVPSNSGSIQSPAANSLSPGVPVEKSSTAPINGDGLGLKIPGGLDTANNQQEKVCNRGQPRCTSGGSLFLRWFMVLRKLMLYLTVVLHHFM